MNNQIVTGFEKTIPNSTRIEMQFIAEHQVKPTLPKPTYYTTYTLALPGNTKHIAIDSQVCFHR